MKAKSLILSSSGLKNVIKDNNEFTFVFGEREIHMSNIFAEFISPIVSHLHHSDPTINKFSYKSHQNSKIPRFEEIFTEDIVEKLISISSGMSIDISQAESQKMRLISILLCNEELFTKIDDLYPVEANIEAAVKRLEELEIWEIVKNMATNFRFDTQSIVSVIARNFYLIEKNKIKTISKPLFQSIISNDHLKIESEDSLFDIINEYFEGETNNYEDYFYDIHSFYEEIRMKNLSDSKFKELLMKIDPSKITVNLWQNICDKICTEKVEISEEKNKKRYTKETVKQPKVPVNVFSFDGQESNRLNGIIRFLTKKAGGNVHDKGVVSVTASSEEKDCGAVKERQAKNVVDFDNLNTRLLTKNDVNSWLKYDFKERKVKPTHYSIRSKPYGPSDFHPKNWVIEGSNDDNTWFTLDTRSEVTSLCAKSVVCTFDIQHPGNENEYYRYLRIRQTGTNASGSEKYRLGFSSLEYFGSVI